MYRYRVHDSMDFDECAHLSNHHLNHDGSSTLKIPLCLLLRQMHPQ